MAKKKEAEDCCCEHSHWKCHSQCGGVYGLGVIGAMIYYLSQATGFWMGVLGVLKALVWPAFVVYSFLKSVGA